MRGEERISLKRKERNRKSERDREFDRKKKREIVKWKMKYLIERSGETERIRRKKGNLCERKEENIEERRRI